MRGSREIRRERVRRGGGMGTTKRTTARRGLLCDPLFPFLGEGD